MKPQHTPVNPASPRKGLGFTAVYLAIAGLGGIAFLLIMANVSASTFAQKLRVEEDSAKTFQYNTYLTESSPFMIWVGTDYCYSCDMLFHQLQALRDAGLKHIPVYRIDPFDVTQALMIRRFLPEADAYPAIIVFDQNEDRIFNHQGVLTEHLADSILQTIYEVFPSSNYKAIKKHILPQSKARLGLQFGEFYAYTKARKAALEIQAYWAKDMWVHKLTNHRYTLRIGSFQYKWQANISRKILEPILQQKLKIVTLDPDRKPVLHTSYFNELKEFDHWGGFSSN